MVYRKLFICISVVAVLGLSIAGGAYWHTARGEQTIVEPPKAEWYSSNWKYRQALTIDHTQVAENVTYFPVLVKINGEQPIFDQAKADGTDLIFTDQDGKTLLTHEVELYSKDTKELVAWVKIPKLSTDHDSVFYIYYGNTNPPSPAFSYSVWEHDYSAVYLMNQGPQRLEVRDSATVDSIVEPFETQGDSKEVEGKVGLGITFDGQTNVVDIGGQTWGKNADVIAPFTISAWIKPATRGGTIISKGDSQNQQWQFSINPNGALQLNESHTVETTISPNQWQHVVVVVDASGTSLFYKDGVSEKGSASNGTFIHHDVPASIGARWTTVPNITAAFKGQIDDIRISDAARSVGWIRTEYANQSQPENFVHVGAQMVYTPLPLKQKVSTQLHDVRILVLGSSSLMLLAFLVVRVYRRMSKTDRRTPPVYSFVTPLVKTLDIKQEL